MKKNPVVHFEMPYENHERLSKFYNKAFGWDMKNTGPEMGDYVLAGTAETDENRMITTPGAINGGFFPKNQQGTTPYPSVVIEVDNIKSAMKNISDAGGKVIGDPIEIPGIGHFVYFTDSEGNRVSILQPLNMS